MKPFDYWRNGLGLDQITPNFKQWPEGDWIREAIPRFIGRCDLTDFGCGTGRLAQLFPPAHYWGVDICYEAIERARIENPAHHFEWIDGFCPIEGEAILAYTVMLHIADDALSDQIARFRSDRLIVCEILGRSWRRPGPPPAFNREIEDYRDAFRPHGFSLRKRQDFAYWHYPDQAITFMEFQR